MRNLGKQIKKGSRGIRLTIEERVSMRQSLAHFAKDNPVVRTSHKRDTHRILSPYSFIRKTRGARVVSATIIGGLLIGGTVSFAAEGALPGNVLYPVKTQVNERVRGMVAVTPQSKAEWDIKLVERRLSEMKEVGVRENVPLETKETARENVKKYTERAQKRITEFDDNDDDEHALLVAENLACVLHAHENELLKDIEGVKDNREELDEERNTEGMKDIEQESKESRDTKKETKSTRTVTTTNTRVISARATSTTPLNTKSTSSSQAREKMLLEGSESARSKKGDTETLEKTVNDIREMRENLEKRNKEKKAEYERRKEADKKDRNEDKEDERETYISTTPSKQE